MNKIKILKKNKNSNNLPIQELIDKKDIRNCSKDDLIFQVTSLEDENQRLREQNAILQQRDARFQLLSINSPDTILFQNKDLIYTWVINSSPLMAVDQVIGKTDRELLSSAEARRVVEIKKELLRTGESYYEEIVSSSSGSTHHFSMYYQAWHNADGNILGIATYTRDISEQKKAENNLKQQLQGEELVAIVSAQFISAEIAHIYEEIPSALEKMAHYLDADRGFIRFIDSESNVIQPGFAWKDPQLRKNKVEISGLSIEKFPWAFNQLKNHQSVYVTELSEIPSDEVFEKDFLLKSDCKSYVVLPIFIANKFSGYLGFGSKVSHPFWSEREKGLLDLFRSTIISVLERQRREAVLNESQELYQCLVNLTPNMIFLIQDEKCILLNPAGASIFGLNSPADAIGKKLEDIFFPEGLEKNKIGLKNIIEKSDTSPVEFTFQNLQGKAITIEIKTIPVKLNGKPACLGVGIDFTHRKQIEREIEGSRKFLNNILDIAPLAIFVFDRNEDRLVFFNEASTRVLGFSAEELGSFSRKQITSMAHPSEQDKSNAINKELDELPIGQVLENELRYVNPSGIISWLHIYQTPISKSNDGITTQSLTIIQDVTEVKNAQEEVLESEEKYRGLVETIPGIVYGARCDELFTTIFISDHFEKLTSINKEDILFNNKLSWMEIVHPDDRSRLKNCVNNAIEAHKPFEIEYRLQKASGDFLWVIDSGEIIYDKNDQPLYLHGIMTDISDRKRDYEEMRRLSQENFRLMTKAYHNSETKSLLLNEVNHRVKNNLASILGILELEKKRDIHSSADFQIALTDIGSRISGLAKVHEILSSNQWAPVQLEILVRKVIENASASSPAGRKLQLNIQSQERKLWINSRQATALALILNELTTNSIRHAFSDSEGGTITVTIRMEDRKTHRVRIDFADNGPGWPDSILSGGSGGVGTQVIKLSAASPLNGEINFENRDGAVAIITFNLAPQRELLPNIRTEFP